MTSLACAMQPLTHCWMRVRPELPADHRVAEMSCWCSYDDDDDYGNVLFQGGCFRIADSLF